MRRPLFISPSALSTFEKDRQEYFMRYLSDVRPPSMPQTEPMSAGSAFDAYAKSYIHSKLFGKGHRDAPKYDLDTIFESQVESRNRDFARKAGAYCFERYQNSGALADLMLELNKSVDEPRFEFEVKGVIQGNRESVTGIHGGVPLLGRPDIRFVNSEGAHVILDWKLNGFCGKYNLSPMPGYVMLREDCGGVSNWYRKGQHKDCVLIRHRGMEINAGSYLEQHDESWASQLATYGWLLGEEVGIEIIVGIDQIVCNGKERDGNGFPRLRVASHRSRISSKFQYDLLTRYEKLWAILSKPDDQMHFFEELSFEESQRQCANLNSRTNMMIDGESDESWAARIATGREF